MSVSLTLAIPPFLIIIMKRSTISTHAPPRLTAPSRSPLSISCGIGRLDCLWKALNEVMNCHRFSAVLCGGLTLGCGGLGGALGVGPGAKAVCDKLPLDCWAPGGGLGSGCWCIGGVWLGFKFGFGPARIRSL